MTNDVRQMRGGWCILTRPTGETWTLHALFARPQDAEGFGRTRKFNGKPHFLEIPADLGRSIAQQVEAEYIAPIAEPVRRGYGIITSPGAGKLVVSAIFRDELYAKEFAGMVRSEWTPKLVSLAASVWRAIEELIVAEAFAVVAASLAEA